MKDYYEDEKLIIKFEDGILITALQKNTVVDKGVSDLVTKERIKLSKGVTYPVIMDGRNMKFWTMDSRNASSKEHVYDQVEIIAFVLSKSPMTMIFKMTMKLLPAPVKNALFFDMESAEEWIRKESKLLK